MKNKEWLSRTEDWIEIVGRPFRQLGGSTPKRGWLAFMLAVVACLSMAAQGAAVTPIDWDLAVNTSPPHPTTEDTIHLLVSGSDTPFCTSLAFATPIQVEGFRLILQGRRVGPVFECTPRRWEDDIVLPRLSVPGTYRLEIKDEDLVVWAQRIDVKDPLRTLYFLGPIGVTLRLTDPRVGAPREASAVQLTPDAGYFWFFSPENIEVSVKLLDGHVVNGHYWIFLSGMTDLGLTVTVTAYGHCVAAGQCPTKTYTNLPGKRLNIIDTGLF